MDNWLNFNDVIIRFETLLRNIKTEKKIIIVPALLKNNHSASKNKNGNVASDFLCLWLKTESEQAVCFLQDSWFSTELGDTKFTLQIGFPKAEDLTEISIDVFKKRLGKQHFALFYDYQDTPVDEHLNQDRYKAKHIITTAVAELVAVVYRLEITNFMRN